MNATDLLLLAVIGISALLGAMCGLIGVVASLLAWLLAGWAAFRYGALVAQMVAGYGQPDAAMLFAGYGLCFLAVLLLVGVVGWVVRKLVHGIGLSGMDRALGFALGLARGGVIACMLVLLMGFTAMPQDPVWRDSQLLPVLLPGARWLRAWLPDWAAQEVDFGAGRPSAAVPVPPLVPVPSDPSVPSSPSSTSNPGGDAQALPQPGA